MKRSLRYLNFHVTAFVAVVAFAAPLAAQEAPPEAPPELQDAPPELPRPPADIGQSAEPEEEEGGRRSLDQLFAELAQPEQMGWKRIEDAIWIEWSRSGSASMDLLLKQGREALEAEEYGVAIEHLTALTDHAPDFAEGWNARATAFFQLGQYGPALEDIGRALALNPHHFDALSGLAVILEEIGMREDALEAWRMVSEVNPHRPETKAALDRLEREFGGQTL